jgi:hypothetical protein
MKRHIFLTNRREPVTRWLEAFPEAVVKPHVSGEATESVQSLAVP